VAAKEREKASKIARKNVFLFIRNSFNWFNGFTGYLAIAVPISILRIFRKNSRKNTLNGVFFYLKWGKIYPIRQNC
jgi:hypothetical protein